MKLTVSNFINSLFIFAFTALLAGAIYAHIQIKKLQETNAWVVHTYQVIELIDALTLNNTLYRTAMQSGSRFLTSAAEPQEALPSLREHINNNLINLGNLTRDNVSQQAHINELYGLLKQKDLTTVNKTKAEINLKITKQLQEMRQDELFLLSLRTAQLERDISLSHNLLLLIEWFGVFACVASFLSLNLHLKHKERAKAELIRTNKLLKESEDRFLVASEGSNAGLWDWKPSSTAVFYSPSFKKLLGYSEKEFPNNLDSFNKIVHPDDLDRVWAAVNKHLEERAPYKIDYRLKNKEGKYRWIEAAGKASWDKDGKPLRMSGSIIDITDRKDAEEKLRNSEAYKSAILESATDGIITASQNGNIVSCNHKTTELFGYSQAEMHNKNIDLIIPGLTEKLRNLEAIKLVELIGVKKTEGEFTVEISMSKILESHNLYVIIVRDITERKKIDKLKNEFISIVSHELRTPLTSIQGSIDLLVEGATGKLPTEAQELLKIAKTNSERLIRLINDILDIEKIESGQLEFKLKPTQLDKVLPEAIKANRAFADKYDVKLELSSDLPQAVIRVDEDRFMQVITNLISNAIKFSPKNSKVVVSASEKGNKLRVSVKDQGPGIPPEFQERIYQKFAQADSTSTRKKGGTGLGLNISKAIIEKMNGLIGFDTKINEGTTFFVELPLLNAFNVPYLSVTKKTFTVLICENEPERRQKLINIFEGYKFETICADDFDKVKTLIKNVSLDVVVIDLNHYNDATSLISLIRSYSPTRNTPIISISIDKSHDDNLKASRLSILDWVETPFDVSRLTQAVGLIRSENHVGILNILHIEDDLDLLHLVANTLKHEANITSVNNIDLAKAEIRKCHYDLIILDLSLPDGSGVELLPILSSMAVPVIVFSAYELPSKYYHYVASNIIKSKVTNEQFLNIVKASIKNKVKEF